MIILHTITFMVYLLSLMFTYVFYSQWDTKSIEAQNRVFATFSVAMILLFFVQLVLIYIFYGLGKLPAKENESENDNRSN